MSDLDKRNASLNCFFFVNPALIPLLYSDKILSPLRLFRRFFPHSIPDSTRFACGSLTRSLVKSHTSRRYFDSCAFLSHCQVCDIASVTDIWLLLSSIDCRISTLKSVWNVKKLVFTPFSTVSHAANDGKQRAGKEMMQFYKDTKYNDILTQSFNVMWLKQFLWHSVMSLEFDWK